MGLCFQRDRSSRCIVVAGREKGSSIVLPKPFACRGLPVSEIVVGGSLLVPKSASWRHVYSRTYSRARGLDRSSRFGLRWSPWFGVRCVSAFEYTRGQKVETAFFCQRSLLPTGATIRPVRSSHLLRQLYAYRTDEASQSVIVFGKRFNSQLVFKGFRFLQKEFKLFSDD